MNYWSSGYTCMRCGIWVSSTVHVCNSNGRNGGYTYTVTPVDPEAIARRVVELLKTEGARMPAEVTSRDVGAE